MLTLPSDSVFDAVFTQEKKHKFHSDRPLVPRSIIETELDKLEEKFATSALVLLSGECFSLVASLQKSIDKRDIESIKKAKWNVVAPLQMQLYFLWRDGWKLGQSHARDGVKILSSIRSANFAEDDETDGNDITLDSTATKKDRRIKVSKKYGHLANVRPDDGARFDKSDLSKAIEQRTLKLASDVDDRTLKEIKDAVQLTANEDPEKRISNSELSGRINLALGRQAQRGNAPRTKIPHASGGGFFSRSKLIARTELSAAYATARLEAYKNMGITHVRWQSFEDLQRCRKCAERHGMVFALADAAAIAANPIPLHPNCRCTWVAVENGEGGDDIRGNPDRNPNSGNLTQESDWAIGRIKSLVAARNVTKPVEKITEKKSDKISDKEKDKAKQNNILRNLLLTAGVGLSAAALSEARRKAKQEEDARARARALTTLILAAGAGLSLAALYYLVLKGNSQELVEPTKSGSNALQNLETELVTNIEKTSIVQKAKPTSVTESSVNSNSGKPRSNQPNTVESTIPSSEADAINEAIIEKISKANSSGEDTLETKILKKIAKKGLKKLLTPSAPSSDAEEDEDAKKEMVVRYLQKNPSRISQLLLEASPEPDTTNEPNTLKKQIVVRYLQKNPNRVGQLLLPAANDKNELTVNNVDINKATVTQLQTEFGLPLNAALAIRNHTSSGNKVNSLEDLKKIPGVGDRSIAKVAASLSNAKPNINSVPNTELAAKELAAQLGIGSKLAKSILDERDRAGYYSDVNNLVKRVKTHLTSQRINGGGVTLGAKSIEKIKSLATILPDTNVPVVDIVPQGVGLLRSPTPGIATASKAKSSYDAWDTPSDTQSNAVNTSASPRGQTIKSDPINVDVASILTTYSNVDSLVERYHALAQDAIPKKLLLKINKATGTSDSLSRKNSAINSTVRDKITNLEQSVIDIAQSALSMKEGHSLLLNPLSPPYFSTSALNAQSIKSTAAATKRNIQNLHKRIDSALAQTDSKIHELESLHTEITPHFDTDSLASIRSNIQSQISDLESRVAKNKDPYVNQDLARQISLLKSDLERDSDRTLLSINNRIQELRDDKELLQAAKNDLAEFTDNAYKSITDAQSQVSNLPTSIADLDKSQQAEYQASRKLANSRPKLNKQIQDYRSQSTKISNQVDNFTSKLTADQSDYYNKIADANKKIPIAISRGTEISDNAIKDIRRLASSEGFELAKKILASASNEDIPALTPANIHSTNYQDLVLQFREKALAILHGRILGAKQMVENAIALPSSIANSALESADVKREDLLELQKQSAIALTANAKTILTSLDSWNQATARKLPDGSQIDNKTLKQVVEEISRFSITTATDISNHLSDIDAWRNHLKKASTSDVAVSRGDGTYTSPDDALAKLNDADSEALKLRTLNQISITPVDTEESRRIQDTLVNYRSAVDALSLKLKDAQSRMSVVTNKIRSASTPQPGRKPRNTGKLEAQRNGIRSEIQSILQEIDKLNNELKFSRALFMGKTRYLRSF